MEKERIYKDFDLPTKHLDSERHFVPPKARNETEIDRRRGLARGTLLAEHQAKGLGMASIILKFVQKPDDVEFSRRLLAASGINTAWYAYARGSEAQVMRRRLKLPYLPEPQLELRQNSRDIQYTAAYLFTEAKNYGEELVEATKMNRPRLDPFRQRVGRVTGRASLTLACAPLGDAILDHPSGLTAADTQSLVRQKCLQTLQDARSLDSVIGLPPSLAQLADPDSNLSVYWRREAPSGAHQAYLIAAELSS